MAAKRKRILDQLNQDALLREDLDLDADRMQELMNIVLNGQTAQRLSEAERRFVARIEKDIAAIEAAGLVPDFQQDLPPELEDDPETS